MQLHLTHPASDDLQSQEISTFCDLTSGIGGFHYAAASLGLRCVFASEIDEAARAQYKHNFGMCPAVDIVQVESADIPDHDILFGGFPCQPFSIIGKQQGMNDQRGTLSFEIVRILRDKQPAVFVLENVRRLATIGNGAVLDAILSALTEAGYECGWKILNALDYGLPQKRERTIIVGFRDPGVMWYYQWPLRRKQRRSLSEILEKEPAKRHFVSQRIREARHEAHKSDVTPSIWHEN